MCVIFSLSLSHTHTHTPPPPWLTSQVFGIDVKEISPIKYKKDGHRQPTSIRYFILSNQIDADKREAMLPW